ncbi:diguanylate cyclase domain-containing protein [Nocardioides sp. LML1-1-1.1]|uniref:diguanylate cyclase domain-containing protein n=1 Tax=Nocardioides sp. LML1-1-1.1 TaxID=3135248 RepID=UPI00343FF308
MTGRAVRAVLPALGLGAAYSIAILVGRSTRVDGGEISLAWPAAAVAVLWGLYASSLPRRAGTTHWVLLGVLTCGVNLTTGASMSLAVWFVGVNLAMAAVVTVVLRYGERPVALRDPADLGRLVVAVAAGTLVAAGLAVVFFAATGHEDLRETFALFAVRNAMAVLAGVAVALRLRHATWRRPEPTGARVLESVACLAVVVWVFARVFWFNPGLPLAFAVMVPAMWVSLRFSTTVATLFLLAAGISIVWATLLDRGALRGISIREQALLAQGMVACLTLVVLTLALFRDSRNDLIGQLRHLALHDPLTGLANRTLLTERLERALATGGAGTVGVVVLDLDGFKVVNDAWGHDEGDLLLVEIARRLVAVTGPGDTVARFGGDEFVVLHRGLTDPRELELCAERIRRAVGQPYGQASDAPYDRITASIGTAVSEPGCTPRSLVNRADQAMYDAKRAARRDLRAPAARAARSSAGTRAAAGGPARG